LANEKQSFVVKKQPIPATGALGRGALVICPTFPSLKQFHTILSSKRSAVLQSGILQLCHWACCEHCASVFPKQPPFKVLTIVLWFFDFPKNRWFQAFQKLSMKELASSGYFQNSSSFVSQLR
jgi:hypothetical protein